MKGCIEDLSEKKQAEIRKKNEKQEERFKRRMEGELNIEEMKLDMKKKNEDKDIIENKNIQVKLLKLLKTKLQVTHLQSSTKYLRLTLVFM